MDRAKQILIWVIVGIGIGFILFILFCPVGKAKIKTFYKGYPRFIIQDDSLVWQIDTISTIYAEELAWERSKFDIVIEGTPVQYPNSRRFLYDPTVTIFPLDTLYGYSSYPINSNWMGKYDSLISFCSAKGIDYESMLVHLKVNEIYDYNTIFTIDYFLAGWSDSNDADNDNIRDYVGTYGKALGIGQNYIIKDSSKPNWIINHYADSFGLYTIKGIFIDTIIGNSTDSLWYDAVDTSNLTTNGDFETGDSGTFPASWYDWGGGTKYITTAQKKNGAKGMFIKSGVDGLSYIRQIISSVQNVTYRYSVWVKSNSTNSRITFTKGSDEGMMLWSQYVPSDSTDTNWHYYTGSFNSSTEDSIRIMIGYQSADTTDSMFVDDVWLYSMNGILNAYSGVYPYVIDRLEALVHSAIASTESTARVNLDWYFTDWICNIGNPNYVQFQKQYLTQIFNIRPYFDGVFLDQLWQYCPEPARNQSIEYSDDESGSGNNQWTVDLKVLLQAINDTLDISNKMTIGNTNNEMDTAMVRYLDGQYEEGGAISPAGNIASNLDSFDVGSHYPYNFNRGHLYAWAIPADLNKINLVQSAWNGYEQTSTAEFTTRYDTLGQLGRSTEHYAEFEDSGAGRNRSRVSSLANYYIGASDSTYYSYEINSGYLPYKYYWSNLIDIDIGTACSSAFEFASGVDDSGLAYTIIGRKYTGGIDTDGDTILVLYKPKSYGSTWWSCWTLSTPYSFDSCQVQPYNTSYSDFDPYPPTVHSLGAVYFPYRWDGTYDPPITELEIWFNQGVILRQVCP